MRSARQFRLVEAEGFYHGVHLIAPTAAESEIEAQFGQEIHRARHDSVDEGKRLEAAVALLETREPEAHRHWIRLRDETQGRPPEIAVPVVAAQASLLSMAGETMLLGPVMDGFGIGEPVWQAIAAASLVVVASGLLHIALRRLQASLEPQYGRSRTAGATTIGIALFSAATVTVLGWWRAGEMIFAADIQGDEWARFLSQNDLLTKTCVTLLTVGLPFFAAASFEWGLARLRYAIEWRRARREIARLTESLENARKHLQAVTEKLEHRVTMFRHQEKAWLQAYRSNYELGRRTGARRATGWRVVIHVAAVTMVVAACCALAESWFQDSLAVGRLLGYCCMTLGLGGLYGYFALKAWEQPTPLQLYRQRPVIWRDPSTKSGDTGIAHHERPRSLRAAPQRGNV